MAKARDEHRVVYFGAEERRWCFSHLCLRSLTSVGGSYVSTWKWFPLDVITDAAHKLCLLLYHDKSAQKHSQESKICKLLNVGKVTVYDFPGTLEQFRLDACSNAISVSYRYQRFLNPGSHGLNPGLPGLEPRFTWSWTQVHLDLNPGLPGLDPRFTWSWTQVHLDLYPGLPGLEPRFTWTWTQVHVVLNPGSPGLEPRFAWTCTQVCLVLNPGSPGLEATCTWSWTQVHLVKVQHVTYRLMTAT